MSEWTGDWIEAGDHHAWVAPKTDCPNCPCCTLALCTRAIEQLRSCAAISSGGADQMDLTACPCAPSQGPVYRPQRTPDA